MTLGDSEDRLDGGILIILIQVWLNEIVGLVDSETGIIMP